MDSFDIRNYLSEISRTEKTAEEKPYAIISTDHSDFASLCVRIREAFESEWDRHDSSRLTLEIQKKAIIGYEKEKGDGFRRNGSPSCLFIEGKRGDYISSENDACLPFLSHGFAENRHSRSVVEIRLVIFSVHPFFWRKEQEGLNQLG